MFLVYFRDHDVGLKADFETVLRLARRNRDLAVRRLGDLQDQLDEYDADCVFYGGDVPWTLDDVIDQYNYEMLTLESMGLLGYFYQPETTEDSDWRLEHHPE